MKTSNYFILIISFVVFSSLSCSQGAPTDRTQLMNFLLLMPYTTSINFINELILLNLNNIDNQDSDGNTALHHAAVYNPVITNLLIIYGANIYLKNNKDQTAYDLLSKSNNDKLNCDLLLVVQEKTNDPEIAFQIKKFWIKTNYALRMGI